ncbi:uncharacterized protein LOC109851190 isoform X2 [Asparagus officinalis]|uniref:uncharacterized protein LOC109851190 isoform X2 n=1 Tax=Asparagus officinalis TaxID=4686 RepID=UPI00098E76EA|nr:uncharacterized protein LOC109851190 isoform X2 [Asparagus officinalis]
MDSVMVEDSSDVGHKVQRMSDVVVEERTDGEHKAQAGEEVLDETMNDAFVEERTDGDHDAQAREGVLDETMKDVVLEERADDEHDAQGKEEVLDETMNDVVIEERTDGKHNAEVRDEEVVNKATSTATVDESTDGEHMARVVEQETLNEGVGNAIVEENTDGEQEKVCGQEALKETVGNAVVEESTDAEHQRQVREEDKTVGNATVEESSNCEQKLNAREQEVLNEKVGNTIVEENAHGEQKEQVGKQEALNKTVGNVNVGDSTDGENKEEIQEEEALNETIGNAIVQESPGDEQMMHVAEQEVLNEALGNAIVEGNTDGEQKEQVGEQEVLNVAVGSDIVDEIIDGKQKMEDAEQEVLNEALGNAIVEGNTDGEQKEQVGEQEVLIVAVGSDIVDEIIDGKEKMEDAEREALSETVGNVFVEEGTCVQVREEEALNKTVGNATEESTVCEQNLQSGEREALNETVGNTTVKVNNDGEQKVHMEDQQAFNEIVTDVKQKAQDGEEMVNETIGNVSVDESYDGKQKVQAGEEEAVIETMDIDEEHTDGQKKGQVGGEVLSIEDEHKAPTLEEEKLIETIGDVTFEKSPVGEYIEQVGKDEAESQTKGDATVMESTDGEHKAEFQREENKTKKQKKRSMASGTRIVPLMGNNEHVSYLLPLLEKANFSSCDLVWGKVKSHPWWPGQIIDPSDATKLAMKYQKKDSFLIAYFGDKTFAWCDESQLKPFHPYFSQLVKQCSSDSFARATHDILLEVSRRVELGMACSCLPEEDYTGIKCQKIENAAIKGGNINPLIDRSTVANYFQPDKLLEYITTLAQFPNGIVDKLEFVMAQSQLKAFYHLKGYPELPAFVFSGGVMETISEDSPSSGKEAMENVIEFCTPVPSDLIYAKGRSRSGEDSFDKQEHGSKDGVKLRSTFRLPEDGTSVHLANGRKSASVAKAAEKPISSSSGKKHTIIETDLVDSRRCKKRMIDSFDDIDFKSPAPAVSSSFKIGEFIRRAASQLTGAQPILKSQGPTLQKCDFQAEQKKDDIADFDVLSDSPVENQSTDVSFTEDFNSTSEMLSLLCLAASDTMEEYDFVPAIVDFFTGFRNFCISSSSEDKGQVVKRKRGRPKKVISHQATSDISSSEDEKHVEKHRRGMLNNVTPQPATSDISSEEEKPVEKPVVEKRKRGRPRKNPLPEPSACYEDRPRKTPQSAPPASYQDNEPVQKRKRGRPRKIDSQLACPTETRKRGRPRKINAEMVPYEMSGPDYMKDSCWSDMDLQQKKDKKTYIQYQKRRKSTGEQSLSLPSSSMSHFEQRLQLLAMSPKHTFVAERPIITVEEKIVDECMPTALVLSFNNAHSLPSETDLIRTFSRYGRLKAAVTEIEKKTNRAKVVFKRRVDAEAAFSSASKFFGSRLLSYQLKPWTSGSALQANSQGTQEEAPDATMRDAQGAASITVPREDLDAALIAMSQDDKHEHDLAQTITVQEDHDLAPISMVQDNHDVVAGSGTLEDKCDAGFTIGSNLDLSDKHDLTPTDTQDDMEAAPSTMVEDNHGAAAITILQDICDAGPAVGSNLECSDPAEHVIVTVQAEAQGKESSPSDKHDPSLIIMQQENQDAIPVSLTLDGHSLVPTSAQNDQDAAPISMGQDNHDVAAILTLEDNCSISLTEGVNLELSEQAETVILSGTIQVEADVEESLPEDATRITTPQQNQDENPVPSLVGKDDSTPTTTQDNLDKMPISLPEDSSDEAPITTPQDNHDTAPIAIPQDNQDADTIVSLPEDTRVTGPLGSLPQENNIAASTTIDNHDAVSTAISPGHHDAAPIASSIATAQGCDALPSSAMVEENHDAAPAIIVRGNGGPTLESNLEFSEQVEDVVTSDNMQVEPEVNESLPQDEHFPALTSTPQQNQDAEPVALLQDRLETGTTSQDNLDAALTEEAAVTQDAEGVEAEGGESLPQDNNDPALIAAPQKNKASELNKDGSIPITAENLDGTPNNMPQDKHDAAPLFTPQDIHDAAPLSTPQDNQDIEPIASLPSDNQVELDHDAPVIVTPQDKCDEPTAVSNFSEVSNDVIGSDAEQVEAEDKQIKRDSVLVTTQQNQDAELAATLLDKHDSTSTTMVQDKHDAAIIEGGNLEVSEQAKSEMNSEPLQVEGGKSMVLDQAETVMASDGTNLC